MLSWARICNGGINIFGWLISSLGLFLVILQSLNVFNRYFFSQNKYFGLFTTFYDEVLLVGFSALFMLGSAFAFNRDSHVRIDIIYAALPPRRQASVNFIGTLIFLMPMAWVLFYYSLGNIEQAWKLAEAGPNGDDGVTFFWLWKSMVPAFCLLTIVGGMNHLIQNFARITQNIQLTNIVFGCGYVILGFSGLLAALAIDFGSASWAASPIEWLVALTGYEFEAHNAPWVEYALKRKPTPEYRFVLWAVIVWAARLFCLAMIVVGFWATLRTLLGQLDPDIDTKILQRLNNNASGSEEKA